MILIFFNSNNEIKIIVKVKVENIRAYECHKVENFFEKKKWKKEITHNTFENEIWLAEIENPAYWLVKSRGNWPMSAMDVAKASY